MSNMISVASGFQYSVNIGYDLNRDDKLKNFIPTKSALELLEEILLSTNATSTERSRVLIGPYGKGKSHIILMILSMLMRKDLSLFEKVLPKIQENEKLKRSVENYYESNNKILPVVINGSNTSLPQAFLLALQRTLSDNDLMDVMPDTNYRAAIIAIARWEKEFPETFEKFKAAIGMPVKGFVEALEDYDLACYERFERIYPSLTAGSVFNPFLGFDVVELYESVAKSLKSKGYTGMYVIYDEFSKFLEANISEASVSDTKMLQDFAEKCNRSGEMQLHLMLISHKEITNYIDTLPKQKVDGWRGISGRLKQVYLNNNFSQTYEIISSAIQKNGAIWEEFCGEHEEEFASLEKQYQRNLLFSDLQEGEIHKVVFGCYPLHPASTFILPRLSERVAQNERTLFTFLSSEGDSTLLSFLNGYKDDCFKVITPDLIFDYFEPLFKKEAYVSSLHEHYVLCALILNDLEPDTLECKIVKTISLTYILEQFEKLKPTRSEIVTTFSVSYSAQEIEAAIENLIEKEYVVYLKRSNDFLRLKQSSGVDIRKKIEDTVTLRSGKASVKDILGEANFDSYVYPSRYNDEKEMTRYFAFVFIDEDEVTEDVDWKVKGENSEADGIVYAIIPHSSESIGILRERLFSSSLECDRYVFIVPRQYAEIKDIVREYDAVALLREQAVGDKVLFDEYEVIYEDLREVIGGYINTYTHPEEMKACYIYKGMEREITRKAAFTELISSICDEVYSDTPVINSEAINKNLITSVANNSRNKIVAGLLRNELEENLGLTGTGQEVSIMRSTLMRLGVLIMGEGNAKINLKPADRLMRNMLGTIEDFILETRDNGDRNFSILYDRLTMPENHIGLRRGVIPIYLAAVIHEYKQQVIISDRFGQVAANVDALLQINAKPENFILSYLDWNPEKAEFIQRIAEIFEEYVIDAERKANSYGFVVSAMRRWYVSLPKYTKEAKQYRDGRKIDDRYMAFIRLLKQNIGVHEFLFKKLPEAFKYADQFTVGLAENIAMAKKCFDSMLDDLKHMLVNDVKEWFCVSRGSEYKAQMSLASIIRDWCETIDKAAFEQLYSDGTEKCLALFKTVTNDEETFITRLAKLATDLRVEDWNENTSDKFGERLKQYKATAEGFVAKDRNVEERLTSSYQLTFVDENGEAVTRRFDRVEKGKSAELMYNAITSTLSSMGAVTEQEKRQVLMDILKGLC